MKKIILAIIFVEIIFICLIAYNILKISHTNTINVAPIKKEEIISKNDGNLRYFYEPGPNQVKNDYRDWIKDYIPRYTINSDTLNERYDYPVERQKGVFRIIALGDSFTFGYLVKTTDNWVEKLENKLNSSLWCPKYRKFEVINIGMRGYDVEYVLARYEKRGVKYNPDLIIWYAKSDNFTQINEKTYENKHRYLDQVNDLLAKNKSSLLGVRLNTEANEQAIDLLHKNMRLDLIIDYQANLVKKLQLPSTTKLLFYNNFNHIELVNNFLKDLVKNNKNYFVFNDSNSVYNDYYNKKYTYAPIDFHPNKQGHEIIAEDIYRYLKKAEFIIDCN
ncbi:SGNH/GDSL hydrolase family protein [Candidatus Roizmanbacteria bacterium]|jgi:hypothetical protein|nr:SGNH/GDSL hydrolase family protein [Candidatus Roizmanbacteria bacterium]